MFSETPAEQGQPGFHNGDSDENQTWPCSQGGCVKQSVTTSLRSKNKKGYQQFWSGPAQGSEELLDLLLDLLGSHYRLGDFLAQELAIAAAHVHRHRVTRNVWESSSNR